ncbi:hypothetical protein QWI17_03645 [Gilvimarinus sp. SDUM040013]|uniref:Uncharacterized protein n=1 Tax=Gilvimarinus gilvus TaxID=3058038 RepID=A0ABU4S386_9GAMM|nr:hypothetical protein [Gilvimarinus sp. SDUM040013]MDO3384931.1 hypothetical protein [Gilvimarinus sp. SDUM040013]MDX6851557.1 hypothetical protein [Gilvimarinus sp. SDUM040013]
MKNLIMIILIFTVSTFATNKTMALTSASASIEAIGFSSENQPYEDFITLNLSQLGGCTLDSGKILLRFKRSTDYSKGYSIALAAYMANKPIRVWVDESDVDSQGRCYIQLLRI